MAKDLQRIANTMENSKTLDEWRVVLETLEGAWAAQASPMEIVDDPQVHANGYLATATGDNGSVRVVSSPMQFDGKPLGELRTMSEFGADTELVLLDLGYDWDQITALKEAGATL